MRDVGFTISIIFILSLLAVCGLMVLLVVFADTVTQTCEDDCTMLGHTYFKCDTVSAYQRMCWCKTEGDALIQIW